MQHCWVPVMTDLKNISLQALAEEVIAIKYSCNYPEMLFVPSSWGSLADFTGRKAVSNDNSAAKPRRPHFTISCRWLGGENTDSKTAGGAPVGLLRLR